MWLKRRREPVPMLDGLIASDEAATCPPVVQEILQGVRGPAGYQEAYEAIMSVHMLESPMPLEIFEQAAALYRTCRAAGFTIRSSHDCLIAVCAIRNDVPLLHADIDFEHIARVSTLRFA
jgi:predicted nucleic acid-binding protein